MATSWVTLTDTDGKNVDVNLDNVAYMRRDSANRWTLLTFIDSEERFGVKETLEEIRSKL
jgi:hypothetical protein